MKMEGYFQIRLGKPKISKMSVQHEDCQKLLNDYQKHQIKLKMAERPLMNL